MKCGFVCFFIVLFSLSTNYAMNTLSSYCTCFLSFQVNYLIPTVICVLLFIAFRMDAYVSSGNLPCLIALLLLYGYVTSFQSLLSVIHFLQISVCSGVIT